MNKKIVFFINHVSFFVSHRLPLALHAKKNGYDVVLITGMAGSEVMEKDAIKVIKKHGITHKRISISASGFRPLSEMIGLIQLMYQLLAYKPSLIHLASTKGIIYGGIIARLINIRGLVVSFAGMGYLFTGKANFKKRVLQEIFLLIQKFILNHKNLCVIVQNKDDKKFLIEKKLTMKKNITLIKGSGVDLKKFKFSKVSNSKNIVLFPSRLLINKGVIEFLESAKILTKKYPNWKFILVGSIDYKHPTSLSIYKLKEFLLNKNIEWIDYQKDIYPFYKKCSIVCLPSYREGMPKSILEAASVGRPVVTSNAIGCKESVLNNVTGLIVPIRNIKKLAHSIEILIKNKNLRVRFGKNAREFAEENFDLNEVKNRILNIYNNLLKR
tara:strand:- start:2037 stop:3188 length:1152 start_codon:yes stop_codon:yes gene_type:complete